MADAKRQLFGPRSTGEPKRVVTQTRGHYFFHVLYIRTKAATLHFFCFMLWIWQDQTRFNWAKWATKYLAEALRPKRPPSVGWVYYCHHKYGITQDCNTLASLWTTTCPIRFTHHSSSSFTYIIYRQQRTVTATIHCNSIVLFQPLLSRSLITESYRRRFNNNSMCAVRVITMVQKCSGQHVVLTALPL